ncbi:carbohydrate-binding module family 43 protein [Stipitochalara longipes BDJ]|nr:carbohydrate-binding module family 43 protein [Stipitochalara longipes BDJ]
MFDKLHQGVQPQGSKFFFKTNGTQFFIKGVAYQQVPGDIGASTANKALVDNLADSASCNRDIPYLKQLGANLVRVYSIDPQQDHSVCMGLLDKAGIYVLTDLANNKTAIDSENPTWNVQLYQQYISVVDVLQNYSNVIGFSVGNEVVDRTNTTSAAAFVKAAVRDVKAYIKSRGYRSSLGVGYAQKDLDETSAPGININMANYLNCGDDANTVDFWGFNSYSWCGPSDYVQSEYTDLTQEFATYSSPVFFSEYGCNAWKGNDNGAAERPFTEVAALYGSNMSSVFSGGVAFKYFEDNSSDIKGPGDFGLVSVVGTSIATMSDFNALATQLHSASPTGTSSAQYTPLNTAKRACPTLDSNWQVAATGLPPTPNSDWCSCMTSTLSCKAKSTLNDDEIAAELNWICGPDEHGSCLGFHPNTTTGTYPTYGMCNPIDKLSLAFNTFYEYYNKTDCTFGGNGTLVAPTKLTAACASLLNVAAATGTSSGGAATTSSGTGSTTASNNATSSVVIAGGAFML